MRKLKTTIYRKPTHTDRLLDQSSYNPTSHKAATIRTLTRRAQLVCDSPDSLQDETDYLNNVFSKNNCNTDFVRRPPTDVIQLTLTLKMTTAQVIETSVTVNNNNPVQEYVHPDDQIQPTFEE